MEQDNREDEFEYKFKEKQVPTGRESDQMEQDSKENVKKSLSAKFRVPTGREKVNK